MTEPAPGRRPTIMEVARLADVSHQTVSRYFRAPEGLKPGTRARVEAAVAQLDYRPDPIARSMRTGRTGRIAVVAPILRYSPARMLAGASAAAHAAGYAVEVVSLDGDIGERGMRVAELAGSGRVDGILSLVPLAEAASPRAVVVVSADYDDQMRGIGALADASAVGELVRGLVAQGHRRFLHVTGDLQFASARARLETFRATLAELGLDPGRIVEGDWSAQCGLDAVRALPDGPDRPTAVIAANDLVAAGAVRGALTRGWSVPRDLSVTGWDDEPLGAFLQPSLTTVDVDLESLGSRAMGRLIAALGGTDAPPDKRPLHAVIWRESTAAAPAG